MISTVVVVKVTWQPASQNCPMDRRVVDASSGMIWIWWAADGSIGRSSLPSCVDVMVVPLGVVIVMGTWQGICAGQGQKVTASHVLEDGGSVLVIGEFPVAGGTGVCVVLAQAM
jgi:hypothetical protein